MKQKYVILKDADKKDLIIKEFAELDKGMLSLLCEESYSLSSVEEALNGGSEKLSPLLRTKNLYPPSYYTDSIADAIRKLIASDGEESVEIFFDDIELLAKNREDIAALEAMENEDSDIDDLLEDDDSIDDEFADDTISSLSSNSSIKIADDESLEIEDDG